MSAEDAHLDQLLDQVPRLSSRVLVEELSGGLTNRNYKVVTPDGDYVVRCSGSDAALLGIDRDAEHDNTGAAHAAGVGAEVFDYRPDLGDAGDRLPARHGRWRTTTSPTRAC